MTNNTLIKHSIQIHIINALMNAEYKRFRDLRPPGVDTNLYSYHLKLLQKQRIIVKEPDGYTFEKSALLELEYVDSGTRRLADKNNILILFVIQNSEGDILLYKRQRQPFAEMLTLPGGVTSAKSESLLENARELLLGRLGIEQSPEHGGDCYIRIVKDGEVISSTFAHIFRCESDKIVDNERLLWARPHKLGNYDVAPCVEQIMARTFFRDEHFFEEFEETW